MATVASEATTIAISNGAEKPAAASNSPTVADTTPIDCIDTSMSNGHHEPLPLNAFSDQSPPQNGNHPHSMSDCGTNLIINYLPQGMTQDEVRSLFGSMGDIESCKLIRDKVTGQSLGYAFVNYVRKEDALRALTSLNGLRLQNKTIKVSVARPSNEAIKGANLYVSGLPKTLTQKDLEKLFQPYGSIITSRILNDNVTGLSKGVGFVRFDRKCEAEDAIEKLNGATPFGGTDPIQVKFANSPASVAQKAVLQMAQAASTLLPLTMLHTPTTGASTVPRAVANMGGGGGGGGGPIHHTSHLSRYRYSPLAGVSLLGAASVAAANPLNQIAASVPAASAIPDPSTWYANNNLLMQQLAAFASTNRAVASLGPSLSLQQAQLIAALSGQQSALAPNFASTLSAANYLAGLAGVTATHSTIQQPVGSGGFTLLVNGLGPETEEGTLWRLFAPFGAVVAINLIKDVSTSRCKGQAFVIMANYEESLAAIQSLNGTQLGSRTMQVSLKQLLPAMDQIPLY